MSQLITNELFELYRLLQQSSQKTTSEECEKRDHDFNKVEGYLKDWCTRNASIAGAFAAYVTTLGRTVRFDPESHWLIRVTICELRPWNLVFLFADLVSAMIALSSRLAGK